MAISNKKKTAFISYYDDGDQKIEGWVELIEQTPNYIKFKTFQDNIITISYNRLIKLKESVE